LEVGSWKLEVGSWKLEVAANAVQLLKSTAAILTCNPFRLTAVAALLHRNLCVYLEGYIKNSGAVHKPFNVEINFYNSR